MYWQPDMEKSAFELTFFRDIRHRLHSTEREQNEAVEWKHSDSLHSLHMFLSQSFQTLDGHRIDGRQRLATKTASCETTTQIHATRCDVFSSPFQQLRLQSQNKATTSVWIRNSCLFWLFCAPCLLTILGGWGNVTNALLGYDAQAMEGITCADVH